MDARLLGVGALACLVDPGATNGERAGAATPGCDQPALAAGWAGRRDRGAWRPWRQRGNDGRPGSGGCRLGSLHQRSTDGQCYQEPKQDQIKVVPCSQPHDGEVFATVPLRGQALPSEAELERLADQMCAARFRTYVGVASHVPKLYFGWWAPTTEAWADGGRTMVCTLETLDGSRLVGSKRNAGIRTTPRLHSIKVAKTVQAGAFRIWVTRMTCGYLKVADLPPAKHGQYCVVEFTATNTELSPAWLHDVDQRLSATAGKSFKGVGVGDQPWDHDVQPGQRVTTRLVFDLPRGVRPVRLRLQGFTGHDLTGHDLGPMVTGIIKLPPR